MIRYVLIIILTPVLVLFFNSYSYSWTEECNTVFYTELPCEDAQIWIGICSASLITDPDDPHYNDRPCKVTCSKGVGKPYKGYGAAGVPPDGSYGRIMESGDTVCSSTCDDFQYVHTFGCQFLWQCAPDGHCGFWPTNSCCMEGQPPGPPLPECDPGKARYNGSTECTCPPAGEEDCLILNELSGKALRSWDSVNCECKCQNNIVWGIWLEEDCNNSGYCWKASYSTPDQSIWWEGTVSADFGRLYYWHQEDGGGGDITFFKGPSWFDIIIPAAYAQTPEYVEPHWEDWGSNAHFVGNHSGGCGTWRSIGVTHEDEPYIFEFNIWSGCDLVYYSANIFPTCIGGCGLDWDNSKIDEIYQSLFTKIPFSLFSYVSSFFDDLKSLGNPSSLMLPLPFYGYVEVPAMDLSWLRSGLFILLIVYVISKIIRFIL